MSQSRRNLLPHIVAALIIVCFIAGIIYLSQQQPAPPPDSRGELAKISHKAKREIDAGKQKLQAKVPAYSKELLQPGFEFHNKLQHAHIDVGSTVPVKPASKKPTTAPESAAPAPAKQTPDLPAGAQSSGKQRQYMLQISSFKEFERADQMRAELILDGWMVKVQQATIGNGQQVYRVQLGPYAESQLAAVEQRLQNAGHKRKPLLLPLK